MKTLQAGTKWFLVAGMLILTLCAFAGQASAKHNPWGNKYFNTVQINQDPSSIKEASIMLLPGQYMFSFSAYDFDANRNQIPGSGNYGYMLVMQGDGNLVIYGGPYWGTPIWGTSTAGQNFAILDKNGHFLVERIPSPSSQQWERGASFPGNYGIELAATYLGDVEFWAFDGSSWQGNWSSWGETVFPHAGCHNSICSDFSSILGSEVTVVFKNALLYDYYTHYAEVSGLNEFECANYCVQDTWNRCIGFNWIEALNPTACRLFNDMPDSRIDSISGATAGYIKGRCAPGENGFSGCRAY